MGHLHLTLLMFFFCRNREERFVAFVGMICSMDQADNASKHGQKLKIVVDRKCREEFRRFGAFSMDGLVLWSYQ